MRKIALLAAVFGVFSALAGGEFRRPISRVASMDPIRAASVPDCQAVALVYETPLEVDYTARPYRLAPNLCDLPVWSEDALTCTMRVRRGHSFTADPSLAAPRPVTAADVAYSLRRLGDKSNASPGAWLMRNVASVEALDAETVQIRLKEPLYVFEWYLAMPYTAAVPHEAVEHYGQRFGSVAVGSGPYRLESWRRNYSMVFRRNNAHPVWQNRKNTIDTVKYFVIDDPSTQFLMFLNGELDLLPELSQDCREAVAAEMKNGTWAPAKGRLVVETPLSTFYTGMNLRDKTLQNRYLRQALNCAFDFEAWERFRASGVARSATPVPPGVPARLEEPFQFEHNEEKAVELLEKAGYSVHTDPSTRRRQTIDPATGRRLVLTYTLGRAAQQDREEAEFMKSFYERIGIDLELKFMTWTSFLQAVDEGRVQLFRMGWVGDYPDPENFMQLFTTKNLPPGPNHTAYSSPAFDAAYDRAMAERDPARRAALWRQTQGIVREDCPWIFMYHPQRFSLVSPRLKNYIPGDFAYGMEKYMAL